MAFDGGKLVVGFLIGKAGSELVISTRRDVSFGASRNCRSGSILMSSPAISRMRLFMRAFRACQLPLPSRSSSTFVCSEP